MKDKSKNKAKKSSASKEHLFTFRVSITRGIIAEEFVEENPVISRTIQIRGGQTLEDLHYTIFDAFDREDEHMYRFYFGIGAYDKQSRRLVLPMEFEDVSPFDKNPPVGDLTETTIESLKLRKRQKFGYLFDYGDDWDHQIEVLAIDDEIPHARYPGVTEHVGESPPQYLYDEEDY